MTSAQVSATPRSRGVLDGVGESAGAGSLGEAEGVGGEGADGGVGNCWILAGHGVFDEIAHAVVVEVLVRAL